MDQKYTEVLAAGNWGKKKKISKSGLKHDLR